jgi:hypothetical protein
MTEAEAHAALAAFESVGKLEAWIAVQPWHAVPGGWLVLDAFEGWRVRLQIAPGGLHVLASDGWGDPAAWFVPA